MCLLFAADKPRCSRVLKVEPFNADRPRMPNPRSNPASPTYGRALGRAWLWRYLALAGFNVLTVCACLVLNQRIMTIYESSVRASSAR